jgi:hypothetical protein
MPADQALPATCPACGVVLAKVGQAVSRSHWPVRTAVQVPDPGSDDERPSLPELLLHTPGPPDSVRAALHAALLAGLTVWGLVLIAQDFRSGEIMQSFLHGPLLVFHEAGHVLFSFLGHWMTVAGGTLMQLAMPLVLSVALLWKRRDPFGAAVGLWFFGVSVLDVAPYVYDAFAPQLMLLSGQTGEEGGHDWIELLGSAGWLGQARALGAAVHHLGAVVVLGALVWAGLVLRHEITQARSD